MRYERQTTLRDGTQLTIRNLKKQDAAAAIWILRKTAGETDFLLREPAECGMTIPQEEGFIEKMNDSPREVLLGAFLGGELIGMANLSQVAARFRVRHRATVGVSVVKARWGKGVGSELMRACIELAKSAGYEQLELSVVDRNDRAAALYVRLGFERVGRIPHAMKYRDGSYADYVNMVLNL